MSHIDPRLRRWLPLIGPLLLLGLWSLLVATRAVSPVLLPGPLATLEHLGQAVVHGTMVSDFLITLSRTAQAFAIATLVGDRLKNTLLLAACSR